MNAIPKPFLVHSVPKSGTHLIHQLLDGIPQLRNSLADRNTKFFVNNPPTRFYEDHYARLSVLKPGQFGIGHLHWDPVYAGMLRKLGIKHIYLYRDPRDVLVSLSYFIPDKWPEHPLHKPFQVKYTTPRQRILVLLQGIAGTFPNFRDYFGPYYGWLEHSDGLRLSFEELVSTPDTRRRALYRMIHFIWEAGPLPATPEEIAGWMEANVNPAQSGTFRQGRPGSWRNHFDDEIKKVCKDIIGGLIIRTGYEKNNDW